MPAPEEDPRGDLALLIDAAQAAGVIAGRYWRQSPESWDKPGAQGPVTEADLAIDRMLHAELLGARPGYGWLSEETEDGPDRLATARVFIVDPIDGTRAFMAGDDHYAHSLAVAEAGRVTAAVVYVPQIGALYTAGPAGPARLNGQPIAVSAQAGAENATLIAGRQAMKADHWRAGPPPGLRRLFRPSLAYRMCLVAEGQADGMVVPGGVWEWDIAAGDLIVRRAGGRVTDRSGAAIGFNAAPPRARGLVAGPPALHADLLARLVLPA